MKKRESLTPDEAFAKFAHDLAHGAWLFVIQRLLEEGEPLAASIVRRVAESEGHKGLPEVR